MTYVQEDHSCPPLPVRDEDTGDDEACVRKSSIDRGADADGDDGSSAEFSELSDMAGSTELIIVSL
jgi:hypothetical protein